MSGLLRASQLHSKFVRCKYTCTTNNWITLKETFKLSTDKTSIMKGLMFLALLTVSLMEVESQRSPKRIYTILINLSFNAGRIMYTNDDGMLSGITLDLVDMGCREAGIQCRFIRDLQHTCWQSNPGAHPSGGQGLLGRWYDACPFTHTLPRSHVFQFAMPMFVGVDTWLWALKDSNVNEDNLRGKVVGFKSGSQGDQNCLARKASTFVNSPGNVKIFTRVDLALEALKSGELDAYWGPFQHWQPSEQRELKKVSIAHQCYIGGTALMARKDSDLPANFNVGWTKLKMTNKLAKACEEANKRHETRSDTPRKCIL